MYQTPTMERALRAQSIRGHLSTEGTQQGGNKTRKRQHAETEYRMPPTAWANCAAYSCKREAHHLIGSTIIAKFNQQWFAGVVAAAAAPDIETPEWMFRVTYSDGDCQDLTEEEVQQGEQDALEYDPKGAHKAGIPMAEQIDEAQFYAKQWEELHPQYVREEAARLEGKTAGMEYMATNKWEQGPWHRVLYHLDKSDIGQGQIHATRVKVDLATGTITPMNKRRLITPNDSLGQHTRVEATAQTIPQHEMERLQGWGEEEDQEEYDRDRMDSSYNPNMRGTMHGYFPPKPTHTRRKQGTLPEYEEPIEYQYSPLTGQARERQIHINWNVQEPTIAASADKKLLAVGRNGITMLYSKGQDAEDIPLNAKYSAGSRKTKLNAGWIH
jgi:hypothetical protein